MAARPPASARPQPVHAFKPTSGTIIGSIGIVAAASVAVVAVLTDHTVTGLRTALGAALVAVVVWMVLLRPRVTAYADTLVLRNMASDFHIPLAAVDAVSVRQMLTVSVGSERYTCAGIGRSTRSVLRATRGGRSDAPAPEVGS
jgi:hypothetical protein